MEINALQIHKILSEERKVKEVRDTEPVCLNISNRVFGDLF